MDNIDITGPHPQVTLASPSASVVTNVEAHIRRFCVLPDCAYLPIAVWAVATHCANIFDCFPYLSVFSPVRESGKTTLLEVLERLTHRAWIGTAPTPAALFRMIPEGGTILLDEVEFLNVKNGSESIQVILAIINSGHRRGTTIPRCDGPKHKLMYFPVYGPKAFGVIGRLPDTLVSRSIVVNVQRRTSKQFIERRLRRRFIKDAQPVHEAISAFSRASQSDVDRAYEQFIDSDLYFLKDRDADLWIPLFATCSIAAPDRLDELKQCALQLCASKAEDSLSAVPPRFVLCQSIRHRPPAISPSSTADRHCSSAGRLSLSAGNDLNRLPLRDIRRQSPWWTSASPRAA